MIFCPPPVFNQAAFVLIVLTKIWDAGSNSPEKKQLSLRSDAMEITFPVAIEVFNKGNFLKVIIKKSYQNHSVMQKKFTHALWGAMTLVLKRVKAI